MFDKLTPFFNGKTLGLREYARLQNISPSTAKLHLEQLEREHMITSKREHNLRLFKGEGKLFQDQKIEYNVKKIKNSKLIDYLEKLNPTAIILFGSQAKGTNTDKSDIDIAVVIPNQSKKLN
jgi:DNA polymerase sigma